MRDLGCSGVLIPSDRQIVLNGREAAASQGRRRFTLAHEVGHWVCQCLEGRVAPIYCRKEEVGVGEGRLLEREANVFAAELLMPEPLVRRQFERDTRVDALAPLFGVSTEAMHWRLYSFGLSDKPS